MLFQGRLFWYKVQGHFDLYLWGKQDQLLLLAMGFCFSISCRSDSSEQVGAMP